MLDPELNARTATAQLVVKLGHKIREDTIVVHGKFNRTFAGQDQTMFSKRGPAASIIPNEYREGTKYGVHDMEVGVKRPGGTPSSLQTFH